MRLVPALALGAAALGAACTGDPAGPPSDAPIVELAAVTASDIFVAVGTEISVRDGAVEIGGDRAIAATSATGTSWEWIDTGHAGALLDVAHGSGVYVAVGQRTGTAATALILRSTDGVEWEEVQAEGAIGWRSIAHGNGRFLAVGPASGGASLVAASVDGTVWEVVAETDLLAAQIDFALGEFHVFGEAGVLFSSADGETWTTRAVPGVNRLSGLVEWDGRLLAGGVFDCCFGEMPERIEHYTVRSDEEGALHAVESDLRRVRTAHAGFPGGVLALTGEVLYRSTDADVWTPAFSAEPGAYMLDVLYAGGRVVVVGRRYIVTSTDAERWTRVAVPASIVR